MTTVPTKLHKDKRRRPATASKVRIVPEFHEQPNVEKIGRVLLAIAIQIAKEKEAKGGKLQTVETQKALDKIKKDLLSDIYKEDL